MALNAFGGASVVISILFLGGSFFPFEAMPDWLAAIGRWTPNGWAMLQFKAILGGGATAAGLLPAAAGLLAALVLGALVLFYRCHFSASAACDLNFMFRCRRYLHFLKTQMCKAMTQSASI